MWAALPLVVNKLSAGIQHLKQEDHKRVHLGAMYYTQESLHKSLSFHYQCPYCQNTLHHEAVIVLSHEREKLLIAFCLNCPAFFG